MKRQERVMKARNGILKTISTATSTKKKGKPRVVKGTKEEVGKVIIEKKSISDGEFAENFKAEEVVMVMDWDEWPCFLCAVVEQLSWGTCWSPFWDMELIGKEASHAFYSEVTWDDDIWDLKNINKEFIAAAVSKKH